MIIQYIPKELVDIILDYDGRIKYKKGKYIDIINKHDIRYDIIKPVISKKIEIMKNSVDIVDDGFYFEVNFDIHNKVGLYYDYNLGYNNRFEIGYYNSRNNNFLQIKTQL
jgi:hypothetical protein